jgi:hypothetical protein
MAEDTYRPKLGPGPQEKLEKVKQVLKELEEQDFKGRDKEKIMWRRSNGTFDLNWIFEEALDGFADDMKK